MAKFPSPLLGYNNNVRHRGRVFHIQTEDSGVQHPHVITHLFMDGGRILKTMKRSYADIVSADNLGELVRAMMKEQHKGMLIALRDGHFDHVFSEGVAAPKPMPAATSSAPDSGLTKKSEKTTNANATAAHTMAAQAKAGRESSPDVASGATSTPSLSAAAAHSETRPISPSLRPATAASDPPLPPELEDLFRYEVSPASAAAVGQTHPAIASAAPAITAPPRASRAAGPRSRPSLGPSATSLAPKASLFGDDAEEKSLDEVILSYLAEDLQAYGRK